MFGERVNSLLLVKCLQDLTEAKQQNCCITALFVSLMQL